jgi:Domain of unknown function (DUF6799)
MKVAVIIMIASALAMLSVAPSLAAEMDGLMMSGGKIVMVQQGKPSTTVDHEMKLSDGSTLRPDGTVVRKDGSEEHMQNGEVIMRDGHIIHGGKATPMCH